MNNDFKESSLLELIKDKNFDISVKISESFSNDVDELLNSDLISKDDFEKEFIKCVTEIDKTYKDFRQHQKPVQNQKKSFYNFYKNVFPISLNDGKFKISFYFDYDQKILSLKHFDKIIYPEGSASIKEIFFLIFECIAICSAILWSFHKNITPPNQIYLFFIFPVVSLLLWCYVRYREKKRKDEMIWVNLDSMDLYRKFFRSRSISDWTRTYYFSSWLNSWLFCILILEFLLILNNIVMYIICLPVVIGIMFFSIGFLLKMFKVNYLNIFTLSILLLLVGFLNKDYWVFVTLIFVIVNQLLSKDILFLSNNIPDDENLDNYISNVNGISLKFKVNMVIASLYLFIVFFDNSKFLEIVLKMLFPKLTINSVSETMIIGAERFILLCFFIWILKTDLSLISKPRREIVKQYQVLINYISSKLYKSKVLVEPNFKDKIEYIKGEDICCKDFIVNFRDLPPDTKVFWSEEPTLTEENKKKSSYIYVIYPNRERFKHKVELELIDISD